MAGRERGGPGAARGDLFDDTAWIVTPFPTTLRRAVDAASELGHLVGATVVAMNPDEHDRAVAAVSHVPQLVASALAALLGDAPDAAARIAGSGFRDTTRLADSDPDLWRQVLEGNSAATGDYLTLLAAALGDVAAALRVGDVTPAYRLLVTGRAERGRLPGKAGTTGPGWAEVGVVVPDRPGELARLLLAAGDAGVNVEDLHIDHAAEHPVGHVGLSVRPQQVSRLVDVLTRAGWAAHRAN
jgi:prephenate dehydrogenase